MLLISRLEAVLLGQRGHLLPWAPVCFALGIGWYFSLKAEPALWVYVMTSALCLAGVASLLLWRTAFAPLIWVVCLVAAGFFVAGVRANALAAEVLQFRYYGAVEGRIVNVDRAQSGALRVTLDHVVLESTPQSRTPKRVRVSLREPSEEAWVRPGSRIMLTAMLAAPSGPTEPGGFDFRRHAWFMRLGAVGYARTPLMLLEPEGWNRPVLQARLHFAKFVRARMNGERGAFAAAIMTGDRSGMSQETIKHLRHTNLAHLLAISGLHMGLLTGLVFALIRYSLLLSGFARQNLPIRKVAAGGALVVSFFYLLLSGGNVATERAFIMATVALGAVLFERRVFSLRAVAAAALIVLALWPEALLGPGFQMSFAATTALVWVFGLLRDRQIGLGPAWLKPIVAVFMSSLVAGLATAPIAAAHFNQFAHYGLIANLLAVPLMGMLVIPSAVLALVLWPIGLSGIGFWLMDAGVGWILFVAKTIAAWEGARGTVVSPEPSVLVMLVLGALCIALWQGRARLAGVLPVVLAFVIWAQTERPDMLIAEGGGLVGVLGQEGRSLSKAKGSAFVAANWLENDGDARSQKMAAQDWAQTAQTLPFMLRHLWRKRDKQNAVCDLNEVLVVAGTLDTPQPCRVYDAESLAKTGAVALYFEEGVIIEKTAREITGRRLWSTQSIEGARQ